MVIYYSFITTAANPGSFAYFLVYLRFAYFPFLLLFRPGRFARFHFRPESFRITVATPPHVVSPNNRFHQMFLSAIMFVIDVDISLYSSLHSVENV